MTPQMVEKEIYLVKVFVEREVGALQRATPFLPAVSFSRG
jgi:hypothetical protein